MSMIVWLSRSCPPMKGNVGQFELAGEFGKNIRTIKEVPSVETGQVRADMAYILVIVIVGEVGMTTEHRGLETLIQ